MLKRIGTLEKSALSDLVLSELDRTVKSFRSSSIKWRVVPLIDFKRKADIAFIVHFRLGRNEDVSLKIGKAFVLRIEHIV